MGQLGSALGASSARQLEATLEKIISDVAAENEFQMYKLVNYRRGGSIMESCAAAGPAGLREVDRICVDVLVNYVYDKGRGRTITAAETLAWRRRLRKEVAIPVARERIKAPPSKDRSSKKNSSGGAQVQTSVLSPSRPYDTPLNHDGCWMLDQRGALGENPLHVLVICDTPTHTRVAKILLGHYPKMVDDIMEGTEYCGLSPLHLAVAYNNMELVQAFVAAGANVNVRAVGKFFMPSDQKERPKRKTNYEGLSYLGEYPLSWAACCENEAIYNYLLDRGADPNLQDTFGNMILHMVVISNKLGMYGYALRHPKKPANNEIVNKAGLTPLTLACVLGRNNIFREMLELSSVEFWRFSNITCSAYPLIALDTIRPDGGTNWKSALMIILDGETQEHLDMLEGGVIQRLLEDKWKTFARNQFLKRLGFLFLHLVVISIAVYLRPPFEDSLKWSSTDPKNIARHCAEFGSLLGCGLFVFVQQGSEIISQGFVEFGTNLARSPAKFIFLISNVCILLCIPCRLLSWRLVEDSLLTFALPGTWFFLMFFAGAVRLTGPFVTMIYSMIAGDMVRFGIIYLIMLLGFSQAFYFLFKSCHVGIREADDTNIDLYETFIGTWMALYQMTLGNYQYSDFSKPKYSGLSLTIFVVFMVLVPILLLNMLIAMMGNTYANVISKSEKEFVKQWAKIVLALERSVDKKTCKEHLNTYGINLGPPPSDGSEPMKGLMVIKSKNKTKAQQRKGALLNWRRVGKKIVNEMRKYGCRGDQLLQTKSQELAKKGVRRGSFPALFTDNIDGVGDDEQGQAPRGGLGEALSQLAFAHDIDITGGVDSGPTNATPLAMPAVTPSAPLDTNCNALVPQPQPSLPQTVALPNYNILTPQPQPSLPQTVALPNCNTLTPQTQLTLPQTVAPPNCNTLTPQPQYTLPQTTALPNCNTFAPQTQPILPQTVALPNSNTFPPQRQPTLPQTVEMHNCRLLPQDNPYVTSITASQPAPEPVKFPAATNQPLNISKNDELPSFERAVAIEAVADPPAYSDCSMTDQQTLIADNPSHNYPKSHISSTINVTDSLAPTNLESLTTHISENRAPSETPKTTNLVCAQQNSNSLGNMDQHQLATDNLTKIENANPIGVDSETNTHYMHQSSTIHPLINKSTVNPLTPSTQTQQTTTPLQQQTNIHYPIMHLTTMTGGSMDISPHFGQSKAMPASDQLIAQQNINQHQENMNSLSQPGQNLSLIHQHSMPNIGIEISSKVQLGSIQAKDVPADPLKVNFKQDTNVLITKQPSDQDSFANQNAVHDENAGINKKPEPLPESNCSNTREIVSGAAQDDNLIVFNDSTVQAQSLAMTRNVTSRHKTLDRQGSILSTDSALRPSSVSQTSKDSTMQPKFENETLSYSKENKGHDIVNNGESSQSQEQQYTQQNTQAQPNLDFVQIESQKSVALPTTTISMTTITKHSEPAQTCLTSQEVQKTPLQTTAAERGELILLPSQLRVTRVTSTVITTNAETVGEFLMVPSQSGVSNIEPISSHMASGGISSPGISHKYRHHRMGSGHRPKILGNKSKRSKNRGPLNLNKLTNKVGVAPLLDIQDAFVQSSGSDIVSTIGIPSGFLGDPCESQDLFSSTLPIIKQSVPLQPLRGFHSTLPRIPSSSTTVSFLPSDPWTPTAPEAPAPISHPLNRWSTNSIVAMSSLVDWEDSGDMPGSDLANESFHAASSLDNDGDLL